MADILRLKRYTTMLTDGRSSVTYDAAKGEVIVAVVVGYEPLKSTADGELDVDAVILDMAKHIRKCNRTSSTMKAQK